MSTDFQVTVTEILGTDSMNNSRVTINNNFKTLASSINSLTQVINTNTSTIGGTGINFKGDNALISGSVNANSINLGSTALNEQTLKALLALLETNRQITQTTED